MDSHAKSPKNRVVYELLDSLVNDQERSRAKVRASEREVRWGDSTVSTVLECERMLDPYTACNIDCINYCSSLCNI